MVASRPEHEDGDGARANKFGSGAADEEFTDLGVAIRTHDQEVDLGGFDTVANDGGGIAGEQVGGDLKASGAEEFLGGLQGGGVRAVFAADHEQMALEGFEKRRGGEIGDGVTDAGAVIKGDEKFLDRPKGAGSNEHRADTDANQFFEIMTERALGGAGVLAAFADDHEFSVRFEFDEGFEESAAALFEGGILNAQGGEFLSSSFENSLVFEERDAALGFLQFG